MEKDFKPGDRVELISNENVFLTPQEKNMQGTVRFTPHGIFINNMISVEFDTFTEGHNCNGHAKAGHGWVVPKINLKHLDRILAIKDWLHQPQFKLLENLRSDGKSKMFRALRLKDDVMFAKMPVMTPEGKGFIMHFIDDNIHVDIEMIDENEKLGKWATEEEFQKLKAARIRKIFQINDLSRIN